MSLLSKLQEKKQKLKRTETIITREDGQKFAEFNCHVRKLEGTSLGFVVDTKPDNIPAKIIECLYLGSQDCCELSVLQNYAIHSVLSVGVEPFVTASNVSYKFVEILDLEETDLKKHFDECIPYIDDCITAKTNILVHCNAGVSRSASVVIAYLIIRRNLTFANAHELVKRARPSIRPNDGFIKQLQHL